MFGDIFGDSDSDDSINEAATKKPLVVGFIGLPSAGKSSLIKSLGQENTSEWFMQNHN